MKTLVVYKSKTGYVENYAKWISQDLKCDLKKIDDVDTDLLIQYDTIVYGGGLYAVGINGIDLIKSNYDTLSNKNIIVFMSGASPYREDIIDEIVEQNFTENQKSKIKFFYLRGGFNYYKLNLKDKLLMRLLQLKLKSKSILKIKLTPDERGMLSAYSKPIDFTRKEKIRPIIEYLKILNLS